MSVAQAAAVALLAIASIGDPFLSEWMHVPRPRPQSRSMECGNYSEDWYVESASGGGVRAVRASARTPRVHEKIPFAIPPTNDRRGLSDVARLDSGWLVGFDAGEFGGGLWWFDSAESAGRQVHAPFDGPANLSDPYKAENVKGFARVGDDLVVLMGLDHLGGRSGRVFRVRGDSANIVLTLWATLDGCPYAWALDGTSLLILTGSSLYELATPGSAPPCIGLEARSAVSIPIRSFSRRIEESM